MKKEIIIKLADEEIGFCLPTSEILECENREGKSILKIVQELSIKSTITLLKYMRRYEIHSFGHTDAMELFDKLTDNGYTLADIYEKIVQPVFVESGLIDKDVKGKADDKAETPFFNADC